MKRYCFILLLVNLLCLGIIGMMHSHNQLPASSDEEVHVQGGEEHPRIALTFDDGPNSTWTPKLLEGLKERGVKATFFVIGEKAEQNPDLIKQMFDEGHIVGNHTFTHVQLTRLNDVEACEEITKTNEILKEITGTYPQFIRPPFGSWNDNLECGITMFPVMWTIDTLDWTTKNTDKVVNKAVSQARDNAIILLHDNYESSVDAALRIVDELQEKGYEFVTVEELLLE